MAESVFKTFWFWMIVIGIIFILLAGIIYAITRKSSIFIWILLALGLILLIAGVIWDIIESSRDVAKPLRENVPGYNQSSPMFVNLPTNQGSLSSVIQTQGFIPQPTNINVFEPGAGAAYTSPMFPRVVEGIAYPININV